MFAAVQRARTGKRRGFGLDYSLTDEITGANVDGTAFTVYALVAGDLAHFGEEALLAAGPPSRPL